MDLKIVSFKYLERLYDMYKTMHANGQLSAGEVDYIKALDDEMKTRTFGLFSYLDGVQVYEHGRWRSHQDCEEQQKSLDLTDNVQYGRTHKVVIAAVIS